MRRRSVLFGGPGEGNDDEVDVEDDDESRRGECDEAVVSAIPSILSQTIQFSFEAKCSALYPAGSDLEKDRESFHRCCCACTRPRGSRSTEHGAAMVNHWRRLLPIVRSWRTISSPSPSETSLLKVTQSSHGISCKINNASPHKSGIVTEWFHRKGVSVLEFPAYSPDLNPMENLWASMQREVDTMQCSTVEQLSDAVLSVWNRTSAETFSKLASSMSRRCTAVLAANGSHTK